MSTALSYHEPSIVTILVLSSFLLLLNLVNFILDRLVFCGLVGQIIIGVAFGAPGGKWLSMETQDTMMQLGYLGLIMLVYEGGLSTSLHALKKNLALSGMVAITGIAAPIALSFVLMKMLGISPLQSFAAGAALCSTSLGTTFTVLSTSGLSESRLGIILTSAAMLDDVVGLVMVQVISVLGTSGSSFSAITVIRPVLVSVAFAVMVPLVCRLVIQPIAKRIHCDSFWKSKSDTWMRHPRTALVIHTVILLSFVTGSSYAGTSNLFAAYLAGASISWFDSLNSEDSAVLTTAANPEKTRSTPANHDPSPSKSLTSTDNASKIPPEAQVPPHEQAAPQSVTKPKTASTGHSPSDCSGMAVYKTYYASAVQTILKPFFFASIGFSVPITQMFSASIVWRGLIYTALMMFGKLLCGLWLIRFSSPSSISGLRVSFRNTVRRSRQTPTPSPLTTSTPADAAAPSASSRLPEAAPVPAAREADNEPERRTAVTSPAQSPLFARPRSLYPAAILASAMVARGEIGFLISAVAQSTGLYTTTDSNGEAKSDLFLVVTWAVLVCTILGPITVGVLVKRVRRLQKVERGRRTGSEDPLGIWGVVQ